MEHLFVTREIALNLRQLGFDEPCIASYRGNDLHYNHISGYFTDNIDSYTQNSDYSTEYWTSAPLYQQVVDWFRNNHNININITTGGFANKYAVFVNDYIYVPNRNEIKLFDYYEGFEAGIMKAISILENNIK